MTPARLTEEQRRVFEETGFLIVPEALPVELTEELRRRSLGLYETGRKARGLGAHDFWELRNCVLADEAFLPLLDWPATFPLVVDLLGPNIQLSTSHLTVLPPAAADALRARGGGWHRDGGTSSTEMTEP